MTTTSANQHRFHAKPLLTVFAIAAIVAASIAIAQRFGSDEPASTASANDAAAEVGELGANGSTLAEALAAGKLDAGLIPGLTPVIAESSPLPAIVEVGGQGSLYDALVAGKFATDFAPGDNVEYVRGLAATAGATSLWSAYEGGTLQEGLEQPQTQSSPGVDHSATISGGHQE